MSLTDDEALPVGIGGTGVYSRIEARLDRIEDKIDRRLTSLDDKVGVVDGKVDATASRLDRLEGKLDGTVGMVRWLGPAGVAALIAGILKASGLWP